jgi:Uma2 family endonuclease
MGLAQPKPLYTGEEYLALEREVEYRSEYYDGEIYAMAGESEPHGIISANTARHLGNQLEGKPCVTFIKDMKVRSGMLPPSRFSRKGFYSYPDIVVVCGERQYHDTYRDVLLNPTVIIEVLSPSTETFDRGRKAWRYRHHLPSLIDYLLVAQDEPFVDHFHKDPDGRWFLASYYGLEAEIQLASIDCTLRLSDIYDRIEFPDEDEMCTDEVAEN